MRMRKKFSEIEVGAKIINFEVRWPDVTLFYTAEKVDEKTVRLLDGNESGVLCLVDSTEEYTIEK